MIPAETQLQNWKNFLQQAETLSKKARRWTVTRKELDKVRKAILEEPSLTWRSPDIRRKVGLPNFIFNKAISILRDNGEIRKWSRQYWETVEIKIDE